MTEYYCERNLVDAKVCVEGRPKEIHKLIAEAIINKCQNPHEIGIEGIDTERGACPPTCPLKEIVKSKL